MSVAGGTPATSLDSVRAQEMMDMHQATLNILEDFTAERGRFEDASRATLNLLEDFNQEKNKLEEVQKALMNILDDFDEEKSKVEITNRVLVKEITVRQKAEENLQRKTEELERSNQDLEQFATIASHDLQEPLRTVGGFAQLVASRYKDKLDPAAVEYLGFMVDGVKQMQDLIRDLLGYSRIGREGRVPEPTDCNAIVDATLKNLTSALQEAGALVTRDPLPTVRADSSLLAQLFQNLIGNALKFHGDRPPKVHIAARKEATGWIFSVSDNGIGIKPEYFDKIFVIFERLHGREKYRGTGIGLAFCKKIVEQHGGRIWVESEMGKGTTFYFTLA